MLTWQLDVVNSNGLTESRLVPISWSDDDNKTFHSLNTQIYLSWMKKKKLIPFGCSTMTFTQAEN